MNKKYAKFIKSFPFTTKGHKRKSEQMGRLTIFLIEQLTMVTSRFSPVTFIEIPIKFQRNSFWNLRVSVKI